MRSESTLTPEWIIASVKWTTEPALILVIRSQEVLMCAALSAAGSPVSVRCEAVSMAVPPSSS